MKSASQSSSLIFSDSDQVHIGHVHGKSQLNVSSLHGFFAPVQSHDFAIKFVKEGVEQYKINNSNYAVSTGQYLLLNGEKTGTVEIGNAKHTKGICINLANSIVAEVIASTIVPDSPDADQCIADFFYTDSFLENRYNAQHTKLGNILQRLCKRVELEGMHHNDINAELFMGLAEALVYDQVKIFKQLQEIPAIKPTAKKDLYRRVERGRDFIDSCFRKNIKTEEMARQATMSQFHFLRLFKKIYQYSPHQYLIHKRLEFARFLLRESEPVSNAAIEAGFADASSFSKAFKKRYGINPGSYYEKKAGFDK